MLRRPLPRIGAALLLTGLALMPAQTLAPAAAHAADATPTTSPTATTPTAATTPAAAGPAAHLTWTLNQFLDGRVHEHNNYDPTYLHQWVTVVNDGDTPLTYKSLTFNGNPAQVLTKKPCVDVLPGQDCRIATSDEVMADYSATKQVTATMAIELTAPDGRVVHAESTSTAPVVDDPPRLDGWFQALGQSGYSGHYLKAGEPLAICRYVNSRVTYEPFTLLSLRSNLLGDLLDPSNPKIASREPNQDCAHPFVSTIVPTDDVTKDHLTYVVRDNEGNEVEQAADFTWLKAPTSINVTVTADKSPVPAPGGTVPMTAVVRNDTGLRLRLRSVMTDGYEQLLVSTPTPGKCDLYYWIEPGATWTCHYSGTVGGAAGTTATASLEVTGTYTLDNGWQDAATTATAKIPMVSAPLTAALTLKAPGQAAPGAIVTVSATLTGTPGILGARDAWLDSPAEIVGSDCELATDISAAKPYTCTFQVRVDGAPGSTVPMTAWAIVKDDIGRLEWTHADAAITLR